MLSKPRRIAFFDVDETLLATKSMFSFLEFWLRHSGAPGRRFHAHVDEVTGIVRRGGSRQDSNRAFYRIFAGERVADIEEAGRRWFDSVREHPGMVNDDVEEALATHLCLGDLTVLVSGSFSPCLEPVREHVSADVVRGTEPEVRDGRYTGRVWACRIGEGKARACRELISREGVDAADCFAYGDHVSDLDMLRDVGHPVVVGGDEELLRALSGHDWRWLPGPASTLA